MKFLGTLIGMFFAIELAMAWPPFGLMLLSIALAGGWSVWPYLRGVLWDRKLPPPDSRL